MRTLPSEPVRAIRFEYSNACAVLHSINVDLARKVEVVGDPDNAAYEWVLLDGPRVEAHSNVGYGAPDVALRDGLIAYHGVPHPPRLAAKPPAPFGLTQDWASRITQSDDDDEPCVLGAGALFDDPMTLLAKEMLMSTIAVFQGDGEITSDLIEHWSNRLNDAIDKPAAPGVPDALASWGTDLPTVEDLHHDVPPHDSTFNPWLDAQSRNHYSTSTTVGARALRIGYELGRIVERRAQGNELARLQMLETVNREECRQLRASLEATQPAPADNVGRALRVLEDYAFSGGSLLGDAAPRFRALADRLAPDDHTEAMYEVWQDDILMTEFSEPIQLSEAVAEAKIISEKYPQHGDVQIIEVVRRELPASALSAHDSTGGVA